MFDILTPVRKLGSLYNLPRLLTSAALTLATLAHTAQAVTVDGDTVLDISEYERTLRALDNSSVTLLSGGEVGVARVLDDASLIVSGGRIGTLGLWDNATVTINGGSIGTAFAQGNSTLVLNNIEQLDNLIIRDTGHVQILGDDVQYDGQFLTGEWENGNAFSFRTYNLTGVSSNGLPGYLSVNSPSQVPLPATAFLFSAALIGLGLIGRKRDMGLH